MKLSTGQVLNNRYRIVRLLGQGGFGAVYRAWDTNLERPVAVKENLGTAPEAERQFKREAQILVELVHPNLPRVFDHFTLPGQGQYLVMDFIEGQDLNSRLEQNQYQPQPEEQALAWIGQVCDALGYLHSRTPPVIHRDIKPANIRITPKGEAILVDFGIAKLYDADLRTTAGARALTPGFAPYEQYGHGSTDARTDIYALGATLYTLLTGKAPPDSIARMGGQALIPPRQLNPAVSPQTETAILRALETRPEQRFQNTAAFKAALAAPSTAASGPAAVQPAQTVVAPYRPGGLAAAPAVGIRLQKAAEKPTPQKLPLALIGAAGGLLALGGLAALVVIGIFVFNYFKSNARTNGKPPSTAVLETGAAETGNLKAGSARNAEKDGMTLLYIPAGDFLMGSSDSDPIGKNSSEEQPQHTVTLDAYWIDQTEVTNAMFARFVKESGYTTYAEKMGSSTYQLVDGSGQAYGPYTNWQHPNGEKSSIAGKEDHPVVQVNWADTVAYCQWAGRRLPSEAEWEKAARGTDGRIYPWGDQDPAGNLANFADVNLPMGGMNPVTIDDGYQLTAPVGSFPAGDSPYGAVDMAGNVAEWVNDWYDETYYSNSPSSNPPGPDSGKFRVQRGGGWNSFYGTFRAASRLRNNPDKAVDWVGFRCALSAGGPTATPTPGLSGFERPVVTPMTTMDAKMVAMALVAAGEFKMGDANHAPNQQPVHSVYLDDFYIDMLEVTNISYSACVMDKQCEAPASDQYGYSVYSQYPVVLVSWIQAQAYCEWRGARLPTEAEWEKAARAGLEGKLYPWGNLLPECKKYALSGANFLDAANCPGGEIMQVASFLPNAYGLLDMLGNVAEWVADWYAEDYYSQSPARNPLGPDSGTQRVYRGGGAHTSLNNLYIAERGFGDPTSQYAVIGLRCAKSK